MKKKMKKKQNKNLKIRDLLYFFISPISPDDLRSRTKRGNWSMICPLNLTHNVDAIKTMIWKTKDPQMGSLAGEPQKYLLIGEEIEWKRNAIRPTLMIYRESIPIDR